MGDESIRRGCPHCGHIGAATEPAMGPEAECPHCHRTLRQPPVEPFPPLAPEATRPAIFEDAAEDYLQRLPILRIRCGFFRAEVVAIYEGHLLKGARYLRPLRLTEAMCHPSGEHALRGHLHRVQTIEFVRVSKVSEKVTRSSKECKFLLKASKGKSLRFSVPAGQVRSVHAALFRPLGDRFSGKHVQLGGRLAVRLLILGVLLLLLAAGSWDLGQSSLVIIAAAAAGVGVIGTSLYFILAGSAVKRDALRVDPIPRRRRRRRGAGPGARRPFSSPASGWFLKYFGIAYWILLVSPLADGLWEKVDEIPGVTLETIVWALIHLPAGLLIYIGYQLCQRPYDPSRVRDARKPILYLRPFEDDAATTLQPSGLLAQIAGVRDSTAFRISDSSGANQGGRISIGELIQVYHPARLLRMFFNSGSGSSEESIIRYFRIYGPVIAIGRPGEILTTPGAARVYLDDDRWQEAVLRELGRCQAVVVQPGLSEGVRWELERIRERMPPHKVLLSLVGYWRDYQGYESLAILLRRTLGAELPRVVPFLDRPVFALFDGTWTPSIQETSYQCPALWPLTAEASDLPYSLLPFVQGMHGGEREPPRRPRWAGGIATDLASIAAVLLGLAVIGVSAAVVRLIAVVLVTAPTLLN